MRALILLPAAMAASLFLLVSQAQPPAHAATINVPCNTADLVSAIQTANNETTNPGPDTLELVAGCNYVFTSGTFGTFGINALPTITSTITINGNGATISRDAGSPAFSFFEVGTGASLNVGNATVSGGLTPNFSPAFGAGGVPGGAATVQGTLTLTNSTMSGNRAGPGGTGNTGTGGVGGSGGAIHVNQGTVNVVNSTLSGNTAGNGGPSNCICVGAPGGNGGAIYAGQGGTVNVISSTLSGNTGGNGAAGNDFGGDGGDGGAIFMLNGLLNITNSTISDNTGGNGGPSATAGIGGEGGVHMSIHGGSITNSTIAGNSGGSGSSMGTGGMAFPNGDLFERLTKNSLVANNAGGDCAGTTSAGSTNNIASDGTCGASFTVSTPGAINLGSLANNGGPTLTRALNPGSSAIDAGDDTVCAAAPVNNVDQRGHSRPVDGNTTAGAVCDVGAFEAPAPQPGPTFTVDTVAPDNDGGCHLAPGDCSLREAITAANADGVSSTVILGSGETYTLNAVDNTFNGLPQITSEILLQGNGSTITRDVAAPQFRILEVTGTGVLSLEDLGISGGRAPNSASLGGGGINVEAGGALHIFGSTIFGNTSGNGASSGQDGRPGGGIQLSNATATLTDSTISGNSTGNGAAGSGFGSAGSGGRGAGIHVQGTSNVTIAGSTISGNSNGDGGPGGGFTSAGAGGPGGGMYIEAAATVAIANSTIANNIAGDRGGTGAAGGAGGGIRNLSANLALTNVTLAGNAVGTGGGAGTGGNISTSAAIVAKNVLASAPAAGASCAGTAFDVSSVANLASDASCTPGFTQQTTGEINLGALDDNGGPTQTMALVPPSSAIDSGDAACTAAPVNGSDQRGMQRPQDGDTNGSLLCDVGAYEHCPQDPDGDFVCAGYDNCPDWANAAQVLPPWTVPADDPDCDGWSTAREQHVNTDPLDHCNDNTGLNNEPDAWPTDFNDNQSTSLADLVLVGPSYNKVQNQDGYNQRFDLNATNSVNLSDVVLIGPFYNKSCT